MSEQSEVIVPVTPSSVAPANPPLSVRQLTYAWVGLWGVAAEDLGKFYQRCIARGEQIMNAKLPVSPPPEVKSTAPEAVTEPQKKPPKVIRPMSVFNAFGAVKSYTIELKAEELLPTKQEVDALTERVEALAREVEALTKSRES